MRALGIEDEIVDQAYEAAIIPEFWPAVLDKVATLVRAAGGVLFVARGAEIRWTGSAGIAELMSAWLDGGWHKRNSRAERLLSRDYPGFVHEFDVFTPEELDSDPSYVDFFRPKGFGWAAGTIVSAPNGDMMVYSLDRRFEEGPFERHLIDFLDRIRPHLARAALMGARLQLQHASTTTEMLGALGLPSAVLSSDGRVIAANPLLEQLERHLCFGAFGALRLRNRQADGQFAQALAQLRDHSVESVFSFPAPGEEAGTVVMHLIPVRRSAHDIFNAAAAILVVTPLTRPGIPTESLLNGLFDLTPSEVRVARELALGGSARSIGGILGISYETVRNHIKTIMNKTGTHRQAELLMLLSTASAPFVGMNID